MRLALGFVFCALLVACGDDPSPEGGGGAGGEPFSGPLPTLPPPDLGDWTGEDPPVLEGSTEPPGDLAGVAATHYDALSCGPHPENVFDLLIPDNAGTAPALVLFIHGGGFVSGSRTVSYAAPFSAQAKSYLEAGFAYATADYRNLFAEDAGVRTPLQDVMVCLQFIRYHADTLGIDPARIVLTGESAGAGTSLWLGTHDDMADAASAHAISRMSTRVRGVLPIRTQSTYDVLRWPEVFSPEYKQIVEQAYADGIYNLQLVAFYAAPSPEALSTDPDFIDYRRAIDMLAHFSADDPPIHATTDDADEEPLVQEVLFHHPFHVRTLAAVGAETGVEVIASAPAIGLVTNETPTEFALRVTAE